MRIYNTESPSSEKSEVQTIYKWKIENFDSNVVQAKSPADPLISPVFELNKESDINFLLKFDVCDQRNAGYSSLWLEAKNVGPHILISFSVQTWLENSQGIKAGYSDIGERFIRSIGDSLLLSKFYRRSTISTFYRKSVFDDTVYVCCQIKRQLSNVTMPSASITGLEFSKKAASFQSDHNQFFKSVERKPFQAEKTSKTKALPIDQIKQKPKIITNCVLQVGDENYKILRLSLINHSSFFNDYFKSQPNAIVYKIKDLTIESVQKLIQWFQTGRINEIDDVIEDLYYASYRYGIPALKKICIEHIIKTLNEENVFSRHILAHEYWDDELMNVTQSFLNDQILLQA